MPIRRHRSNTAVPRNRVRVKTALGRTHKDLHKPIERARGAAFAPPEPPFRRLRGFALDPSLSTELETAAISQITFHVPWEKLDPGPVGEYLEVVDVDPASGVAYEPVDLNHPFLLAQDGLPPSEGNPQFHQQMVYAVAMQTIRHFEQALGRRVLWAPRRIQYASPASTPSSVCPGVSSSSPKPMPGRLPMAWPNTTRSSPDRSV